jgi:hypothetical protein
MRTASFLCGSKRISKYYSDELQDNVHNMDSGWAPSHAGTCPRSFKKFPELVHYKKLVPYIPLHFRHSSFPWAVIISHRSYGSWEHSWKQFLDTSINALARWIQSTLSDPISSMSICNTNLPATARSSQRLVTSFQILHRAHVILLQFVVLIIYGEENKWS